MLAVDVGTSRSSGAVPSEPKLRAPANSVCAGRAPGPPSPDRPAPCGRCPVDADADAHGERGLFLPVPERGLHAAGLTRHSGIAVDQPNGELVASIPRGEIGRLLRQALSQRPMGRQESV